MREKEREQMGEKSEMSEIRSKNDHLRRRDTIEIKITLN